MDDNTRNLVKVGGIIAAIVVAATGAVIGGQAIASNLPAPEPTHTVAVSVYEINGFQASGPEKTPPPAPAPVVEVVAPVVEEPPAPDPVSGRKVPWIPSADPQNAAGGDWDMSVCEGGSASTGADGTPYCD
jgi:hypothetical protein